MAIPLHDTSEDVVDLPGLYLGTSVKLPILPDAGRHLITTGTAIAESSWESETADGGVVIEGADVTSAGEGLTVRRNISSGTIVSAGYFSAYDTSSDAEFAIGLTGVGANNATSTGTALGIYGYGSLGGAADGAAATGVQGTGAMDSPDETGATLAGVSGGTVQLDANPAGTTIGVYGGPCAFSAVEGESTFTLPDGWAAPPLEVSGYFFMNGTSESDASVGVLITDGPIPSSAGYALWAGADYDSYINRTLTVGTEGPLGSVKLQGYGATYASLTLSGSGNDVISATTTDTDSTLTVFDTQGYVQFAANATRSNLVVARADGTPFGHHVEVYVDDTKSALYVADNNASSAAAFIVDTSDAVLLRVLDLIVHGLLDAETFRVSANDGDLVRLRGLPYHWPAAHAAGVLTNDGAGNLSWS